MEQDSTGANKLHLRKKLAPSLASEGYEIPVWMMGVHGQASMTKVGLRDSLPSRFPTAYLGIPDLLFQHRPPPTPCPPPTFASASYDIHGMIFFFCKVLREEMFGSLS